MMNSEQRLSEQFENLANRIFEHSNRRVEEQNRQSLNGEGTVWCGLYHFGERDCPVFSLVPLG
jgi:hypothetical protein